MSNLENYFKKFRVNELKIFETEFWIWSLRPHQATLGAGVLSLKRNCPEFHGLSREEFCDKEKIIKTIEPTLKNLFEYDVINYLMLMMFDKQVHYHILPRYKNEIDYLGKEWSDDNWPKIPGLLGDHLDDKLLFEIKHDIKDNLIIKKGDVNN